MLLLSPALICSSFCVFLLIAIFFHGNVAKHPLHNTP
jgi:hypothetical protein